MPQVLQAAKTMPATPGIKNVEITFSSVTGLSISPFSRNQQAQEWSGALIKAKVNLPPMTKINAANWMAFFASLHGRANTFMLNNPAWKTPLGKATGTPLVSGANNGGYTIATKGWTPSLAGILLAGDWFQAGNYMYVVINTENSDAGGNANFDIWPSLRENLGDGTAVVVSNPQGMFRLISDDVPFSIDEASIYGFAFECMEAI